ncbi:MAG: FRG domain-containing protein [Firmicutes bacterium]|nr:FRG domain-containing protein [Bacillota bacterium]MCL1953982.1 FRG domain-containing protein [Bacillota bacterium]
MENSKEKEKSGIKTIEEYLKKVKEISKKNIFFRGQDKFYSDGITASIFRNDGKFKEKEKDIFFKATTMFPHEFEELSLVDKLAKMQHYGWPTRLIDFTTNPLVALYFACQGNPKEGNGVVFYTKSFEDEEILSYQSDRALLLSCLAKRSSEEQKIIKQFCMLLKRLCDNNIYEHSGNNESLKNLWTYRINTDTLLVLDIFRDRFFRNNNYTSLKRMTIGNFNHYATKMKEYIENLLCKDNPKEYKFEDKEFTNEDKEKFLKDREKDRESKIEILSENKKTKKYNKDEKYVIKTKQCEENIDKIGEDYIKNIKEFIQYVEENRASSVRYIFDKFYDEFWRERNTFLEYNTLPDDLLGSFMLLPASHKTKNERLNDQKGVFCIVGLEEKIPPCEYILIDFNSKSDIIEELDMIGINKISIYNDLQHGANHVKEKVLQHNN